MSQEGERELAMMRSHAVQLSEHFDSVQIFATKLSPEGTINLAYGDGNWFARYGQVVQWIKKADGRTYVEVEREENGE